MFGTVWMASPPEVHATLLSAGPGPGALVAAGGAWLSLSHTYLETAQELAAVVDSVASQLWRGVASDQYRAAHLPYLEWLNRSGADSALMAASHEHMAAAYTAALAVMPTPAELAANHATHATLVGTNFFGINTIPIALNEADYFRMWVQAATTMATYEAVCDATMAGTPRTTAAAPITTETAGPAWWSQQPVTENPLQGLIDFLEPFLKSLGLDDGAAGPDRIANAVTTAIADFLRNFGLNWEPAAGTFNGLDYELYVDATQPIWYLVRVLELYQDFLAITQDPSQIIPALQYFAALVLFDWPTHIAQLAQAVSQPALIAAAAGAVVAPAGLAGLAGLAAAVPAPAAAVAPPVTPMVSADVPAVGVGTGALAAPPPPAAPPAAAPAGGAPAPAVATPPAAVPAGAPLFPYLIGAGPGIDYGSGLGAHAVAADSARKKRATPESTSAAEEAEARRARRRRRNKTRAGEGDAVMDLTVGVSPDWETEAVSATGAGELGRMGTLAADRVGAVGLTRVTGGDLAETARMPLLPESWNAR